MNNPTLQILVVSLLVVGGAAVAPADEGCDVVTTVETSALPLALDLDTTGAPDHAVSLCSSSVAAADLVHAMVLTENMALDIAAEPAPGYDVLLYIRGLYCDDPLAELMCADAAGPGGREEMRLHLPPGDYYIFVDGHSLDDYGPVILHVAGVLPVEGSTWGQIKASYLNYTQVP